MVTVNEISVCSDFSVLYSMLVFEPVEKNTVPLFLSLILLRICNTSTFNACQWKYFRYSSFVSEIICYILLKLLSEYFLWSQALPYRWCHGLFCKICLVLYFTSMNDELSKNLYFTGVFDAEPCNFCSRDYVIKCIVNFTLLKIGKDFT